jgi:hypothetical protein
MSYRDWAACQTLSLFAGAVRSNQGPKRQQIEPRLDGFFSVMEVALVLPFSESLAGTYESVLRREVKAFTAARHLHKIAHWHGEFPLTLTVIEGSHHELYF